MTLKITLWFSVEKEKEINQLAYGVLETVNWQFIFHLTISGLYQFGETPSSKILDQVFDL